MKHTGQTLELWAVEGNRILSTFLRWGGLQNVMGLICVIGARKLIQKNGCKQYTEECGKQTLIRTAQIQHSCVIKVHPAPVLGITSSGVKFTLELTMEAQRGSISSALLFI